MFKFFWFPLWISLVAQLVKNLPATWETWVQSLGWKDPPGEGKDYPLQYSGISLMLSSLIHEVGMRVCMLSHFSHVWVFMTQWAVARQAPLSLGVSRQEYWRELPCLPPGHLPDPGMETTSLMSPHCRPDSLPSEPPGKPEVCISMLFNFQNWRKGIFWFIYYYWFTM